MATYPNNWRTGVGFNPNYTYFGSMPYFVYNAEIGTGAGSRLNWQIGDQGGGFARTASAPDGYGMTTPFPPVESGSISTWNKPVVDLTMTGDMLAGGPIEGTALVAELTGTSGLSLVISMEGTALVAELTGNGMVLRLTVGLDGTASWGLTGTSALAMIVPFDGTGTVAEFSEAMTNLKGLLALEGEWTPFSELSPENLAAAVWETLATQYNDPGTMGNLLNLAGSGSVDYNLLAQAVLDAAQDTPIHSDIRKVNDITVTGVGTEDTPWGPA